MKMKLTALLTILAVAASLTACGGSEPAQTNVITANSETDASETELSEITTVAEIVSEQSDTSTEAAETEGAASDSTAVSESADSFSIESIPADNVTASYSGIMDDGSELTFVFFTFGGKECAAFAAVNADGTALVSAGSYTEEAYSEDGYDGAVYTFAELYAGIEDGFSIAENGEQRFIGVFSKGMYLVADLDPQTAVSRIADAAAMPLPAETSQNEETTLSLASLSEEDIIAGAYGTADDGSELTCAFFRNPQTNEEYVALTFRNADGTYDIYAGECPRDTDAESIGEGTVYSIVNIYTGDELYFGIMSSGTEWTVDVFIKAIYQSTELDAAEIASRLAEDYQAANGQ
ncbi:MAG: hypothetical protein IJ368_08600 [Oscillospiraceae bacterium]|nr:hypothetical protein [Oscillospiraceae bacterium]